MNSQLSVKGYKSKYGSKNTEAEELSEFLPLNPTLNDYYKNVFNRIINSVVGKFHNQRVDYLNDVIKQYSNNIDSVNAEGMKLLSVTCILRDLLSQGWRIKIVNGECKLAPPKLQRGENKQYLRQQLEHERNAQFNIESIKKFIKKMEKEKKYKGKTISVLNLIGDSSFLEEAVRNIKEAECEKKQLEIARSKVKPYIQLVDNSACLFTGYRLRDIWRYFRYTWSIPYKSTPGRNIFYLIRDAAQKNHPVIGIAALGNCVLQLTHRDNYIGWTTETIKKTLKKKIKIERYEEMIKGQLGLKRQVEKIIEMESEEEYQARITSESRAIIPLIIGFLEEAIAEISPEGLITNEELINPTERVIRDLRGIADILKDKQFNNKRSPSRSIDWRAESMTPLYKKKRATELAKLLEAKLKINEMLETENDELAVLKKLLTTDKGKSLNVALQANRKSKIGSNLMEIIVCGAIPPYNELLAGKLVSLLICSPSVIKDYNTKYSSQVSEIASRMKGERIVRDSRLAFLGTTSLYYMGSSQYNRIKVPINNNCFLQYRELGETEGFGSVFFTQETTKYISNMVQLIDGGRKINNVFGEGTSPRLRLIRSGLSALGMSSESYLKHHTSRIVYGIDLASNTSEFLNGKTDDLDYYFPLDGNEDKYTDELVDYWRERWLIGRIKNVDIVERLKNFEKSSILLSNHY